MLHTGRFCEVKENTLIYSLLGFNLCYSVCYIFYRCRVWFVFGKTQAEQTVCVRELQGRKVLPSYYHAKSVQLSFTFTQIAITVAVEAVTLYQRAEFTCSLNDTVLHTHNTAFKHAQSASNALNGKHSESRTWRKSDGSSCVSHIQGHILVTCALTSAVLG